MSEIFEIDSVTIDKLIKILDSSNENYIQYEKLLKIIFEEEFLNEEERKSDFSEKE